jgi:hypothetical protein
VQSEGVARLLLLAIPSLSAGYDGCRALSQTL